MLALNDCNDFSKYFVYDLVNEPIINNNIRVFSKWLWLFNIFYEHIYNHV